MGKIGFSQIGKNGVTENFIETLRTHFKKNKSVRISVLRSARENGKSDVKKYAEELMEKLGSNFKALTIGYVIVVKKYGKTKE